MNTCVQVAAAVIRDHTLDDWGNCRCGVRPPKGEYWSEPAHSEHVAAAMLDAVEIGAQP